MYRISSSYYKRCTSSVGTSVELKNPASDSRSVKFSINIVYFIRSRIQYPIGSHLPPLWTHVASHYGSLGIIDMRTKVLRNIFQTKVSPNEIFCKIMYLGLNYRVPRIIHLEYDPAISNFLQ